MQKSLTAIALALLAAAPIAAEDKPAPALAPSEIVAAAPKADWEAIAPSDLLVMDLAADTRGRPRRVVIQLMPPPFSQGWIGNIRKLAIARFWDGLSVNRVQDNYVVQLGDATEKRALPEGLVTVPESAYGLSIQQFMSIKFTNFEPWDAASVPIQKPTPVSGDPAKPPRTINEMAGEIDARLSAIGSAIVRSRMGDGYAPVVGFVRGFPIGETMEGRSGPDAWPVHCYGMVGVGRNLSPDTGSGAELYTVIGHAPRHLDRNIAVVGRVIEGIEHLSSLPRGTEALGFYKTAEERVPIQSVRLGSEVAGLPAYEYLSTESGSFAKYADARANRRDAFFIRPAGGADVCNIPVPVRRVSVK